MGKPNLAYIRMKARLFLIAIMTAAVTALFTSGSNFFLAALETTINGKEIRLSGQIITLLIVFSTICLIIILGILDRVSLFFGSKEKQEDGKERID